MDSREIEKRRIAFDDYSRRDDNGTEYWSARDIMKPLGYSRWENFNEAIKRAIISCETSKTPVECHFREVTKMVQSGVAKKPIVEFCRHRQNDRDRKRRATPSSPVGDGNIRGFDDEREI